MLTKETRVSRPVRARRLPAPSARKQPIQMRSRETVAIILEAAARVLEKDGLEGYNTNAVAERAGVSIGSLYQYFPNKDALTLALIAKFESELLDAVRAAAAHADGKDLHESLQLVVRAHLGVHRRRAALNRLLEIEEDRLRRGPSDTSAARELQRIIAALLRNHRAQLRVTVCADTVEDLITIARAMVDAALMSNTSRAAAERRVLRALIGYLLWTPPARPKVISGLLKSKPKETQ